jgi:hypothetical protein
MRPASIVLFGRFYLASIALAFAYGILSALGLATALRNADVAPGTMPLLSVVVAGVTVLIKLLLWYGAGRRRWMVARWLIVILFVIGAFTVLRSFAFYLRWGPLILIPLATGLLLQGIAIFWLFRPDSSAWFRREPMEALRDTFS